LKPTLAEFEIIGWSDYAVQHAFCFSPLQMHVAFDASLSGFLVPT
jgi:hypothetical protein